MLFSQRLRGCLAAVAAGILCSLAFAPVGVAYAIFIGVAALILVLRSWPVQAGSRRYVALVGLLFGTAFMGPMLWWMNAVSPGAYIALTAAEAAFFAPTALALRMVMRLRLWPLWATAVWVGFEFLRSSIPFGGFPWGRLAYTAADTPLGAYARLLGIPATSAIVFLVAVLVAMAINKSHKIRTIAAATAVAIFAVGLALPTGVAGPSGTKRVALIQGSAPVLFALWPRGEILSLHLAQTAKLAAAVAAGDERQPDFVLWPENSTDIDPYDDRVVSRQIERASKQVGAPILVGAILNGPTPQTAYNAGIVWDEDGPGERYVKRKVVPFGEYVPFRRALGSLVPRFSREIPRDMLPGTKPGVIDIAGVRLGDTICWDIAHDGVVRESIRSGAEALVVQTSNASFTRTSQPEQQWQISRLRAIETGRFVLVPSTNGISGIANAKGETIAEAKTQTPTTLSADIELGTGITTGVRWRGWLQKFLVFLAFLGLGLAFRQRPGPKLARYQTAQGDDVPREPASRSQFLCTKSKGVSNNADRR